ncbi:LacI family transcriptional regulator [Candidatus Nitrotoga fabula]|uniref:Bacteriophage-related protein n=1 Tax=Candidatus Nitrotoga fabula TaxID=2182327 RepID=A0A916FA25_9PROT|nr:LacI family transcriptional regulator [Candidatus Nitrotoga fabula]CAE6686989.1 conserved hypothetical protein [Candidatus Nitrotoga fabula]
MANKNPENLTGNPVAYSMPIPAGGVQMETFIPWTLVKRGVNRQVITPLDAPQEFTADARQERQARESLQDTALMRALGLAHHWQRLLDGQWVESIAEIAKAEGLDVTQVRRIMRLTLLAPEVVERLARSPDVVLEQVMRRPWPSSWNVQTHVLPETIRD